MPTSLSDAADAAGAPVKDLHPTETSGPTPSRPARWRPGQWLGPLAWSWLGLLVGVSFLATPVKFTVASLPRATALEVGRATFSALASLEWALTAALVVVLVVAQRSGWPAPPPVLIAAGVVVAAVVVQAVWLLPALDHRVGEIVSGIEPPPSSLHTVYGAVEGLQAVALVALGVVSVRVTGPAPGR